MAGSSAHGFITISTVDGNDLWVGVRPDVNKVLLTLSLRSGGDIEIGLRTESVEQLISELKKAAEVVRS